MCALRLIHINSPFESCTSFPRVGEAHYSKCHPDRETTFYRGWLIFFLFDSENNLLPYFVVNISWCPHRLVKLEKLEEKNCMVLIYCDWQP